ncbi:MULTISPECIES: Na+/H+ antiporter NhaC family protein [unclassified Candidatus Frackibacter]|uniref:Na+/H+ antiporter NhaC family protein n=1 Tax=unclassified Candidatus Frackibacter TaxID=2648818 RepID=UPI00088BD2B5|nr:MULTISPECIES: Na+/H+ antiporter NhaC family protein [unclassified Candidatus Frackibacter]SDC26441.1 Na+/H+ antiporter NhaC [Candidatus Frackibacter sp. WG11]SEM53458.1 Na+/H+ antiporter NhaC [Candidatus Frackibacter sp. WG12]SFL55055.1 Na+/H+ antiporter NhaC [Candidatus Frackibacter sp. WG13]
MEYGILALLPPLLAIILAWWSREVLISLFVGVFIGATIINGFNPLIGFMRTLDTYMVNSLTDSWNIATLLFLLTLAGMVGIISRSGATQAVADYLAKKAKTARKAQVATWFMGLLIFFDDYANTLIVGTTMRSITDKLKISREKLAYIVDCTAAPVTSMALISTWVGYEMGLIQDAFSKLGIEQNIYTTFLQTIPYRFYSVFALLLVLIIALLGKDYGPMYDAEIRARKEGKLLREGATPMASKELTEMKSPDDKRLNWYDAFIPIISVIAITIIGLWYNGGGLEGATIREAFGDADSSIVLLWSSFGGTMIAALLALVKGVLSVEEITDAWLDGAKSLAIASAILTLAWSLGGVIEELGTANYIVNLTKGVVPPFLIPTMMFVLPCIVAFATGTSWGTNAIIMPLAIPMAVKLGAPLTPTIGAVLTGCVFGDHCSPISDTTIMSSTSSAADHIDHVRTQIPYAITAGLVAIIVGFIPAGLGVPAIITLPIGLVILYLTVNTLGKNVNINS